MPARFPSFIPRATETWRHRLPETVSALVVSVADVAAAACVAEDGILLINAVTGEKLHELAGHKGGTLCLTFSHDGRLLLSGGEDGAARLWDVTSGEEVVAFELTDSAAPSKGRNGVWVEQVAAHRSRNLFAAAAGKTVHYFGVKDTLTKTLGPLRSTVTALQFLADGKIACANYGAVVLFQTNGNNRPTELEYKGSLISLAGSPGGKWIVSGCQDSAIRVWDYVDPEETMEMAGYMCKVTKLAFDKRGSRMATNGGDMPLVWDFSNGGPAGKVPIGCIGHSDSVDHLSFAPKDVRILATGGRHKKTFVSDLSRAGGGQPRKCFPLCFAPGPDAVTGVGWSFEGTVLVTGHSKGDVVGYTMPVAVAGSGSSDRAAQAGPGSGSARKSGRKSS